MHNGVRFEGVTLCSTKQATGCTLTAVLTTSILIGIQFKRDTATHITLTSFSMAIRTYHLAPNGVGRYCVSSTGLTLDYLTETHLAHVLFHIKV
jgi:hypothetical protein